MSKYLMLLAVLFLFVACKSTKVQEAKIETFPCALEVDDFVDKVTGIVAFSGFDVIQRDTSENTFLIIAQKIVSTKGTGDEQVRIYDQIRFRYSKLENTVWVSHGVLTASKGKRRFTAPTKEDENRHHQVVYITIDSVFVQCNPGQFPNRP